MIHKLSRPWMNLTNLINFVSLALKGSETADKYSINLLVFKF